MEHQGKPWKKEEDQQLKTEFENNLEILEIAKFHQRTITGISARLKKLELTEDRELSSWTKEEENQLKTEFKDKLDIEEICNIHMRSKTAIIKKLARLQLLDINKLEDKSGLEWSYDDTEILKEKYNNTDLEELSKILKRSEKSIKSKAKTTGLIEKKEKTKDISEISYVWDSVKNDYVEKKVSKKILTSEQKPNVWSTVEEEKLKDEIELEIKYLLKQFNNKTKPEIRLKIKEILT
jgi:hypothetical protein